MVDALYPAARALAGIDPGTPLEEAMARACDAAVEGVRNTRELSAKKGRASYLGESTRDVPDPGAIVVTWLLGGEDGVEDFR